MLKEVADGVLPQLDASGDRDGLGAPTGSAHKTVARRQGYTRRSGPRHAPGRPPPPTFTMLNANPEASLRPVIVGGLIGAGLAPMLFYPFSKTLWAGIELTLRPINELESSDVRLASRNEPARREPARPR
ncbi:MAG: hypothetical protein ACRDTE_13150 [Pseudonocardiaceae bacterium]